MDLHIKDVVELKKTHPCVGCGHELMLPRSKVEKSIKKILPASGEVKGGTPK